MTSETCTFQLDTQLLKCCWPPMFAYARNPHVFLEVGLSAVHELSVHSSSVACLLAAVFVRRPPHFFSLFFFLSLSLSLSHSRTHTHTLSLSFFLFFGLYLLDWSDVTSLHRRVLIGKARILSYSCWNTAERCVKIWKLGECVGKFYCGLIRE